MRRLLRAACRYGRGFDRCTSVHRHHALCSAFMGIGLVEVATGDGDDVVLGTPDLTIHADGGPGSDRVTGGDEDDVLAGGDGYDVLADGDASAGADADTLDGGAGRDEGSYARRTAPVVADLRDPSPDGQAGDRDLLTDVESVTGGQGADRLAASAKGNTLDGCRGDDVIVARGGDTVLSQNTTGSGRVGCGQPPDAFSAVLTALRRRPGALAALPIRCSFTQPVAAELYAVGSGATLGRARGRCGQSASIRLRVRLTATGARTVRPGRFLRLVLRDPAVGPNRARAQVLVRG